MHAFLFVGGSTEIRKKKVLEFAQKGGLKTLEFPIEKISDVRELAGFTKFSENTPTAILVNNIENATTEALNAFLKNLEEPRDNLIYILNAKNEYSLIPTIISRCQIIRVAAENKDQDGKKARDFLTMTVGEKYKVLEGFSKREEAVNFIEELTLSAHKEMVVSKENLPEIVRLIKAGQNSINNLNMNGNVGLNLTNLAVKTSLNWV